MDPFSQVIPGGCVTDLEPNSLGKSYWKVTTVIEDILNYKNFKLHIENRMISDWAGEFFCFTLLQIPHTIVYPPGGSIRDCKGISVLQYTDRGVL